MTTLYEEIVAVCSEEQLAQPRNYHTICALVNAQRTPTTLSRMISARGILEKYPDGPVAADIVLSKLETFAAAGQTYSSIVGRALKFLDQSEGLDIGSPATQSLITMLGAGGVLTSDEATKLKALAPTIDNFVTWEQCQTAVEQGAQ
jgi:hypothetical protein